MSKSADVELLHRAWEAMGGAGDLSVLEEALDPEAQWLGVEDGQICESRKMILEVMKRNLTGGSSVESRKQLRSADGSLWHSVPIGPETTSGPWIKASPTLS
jgi:hypothetical protein